jgi:hypothetical protein
MAVRHKRLRTFQIAFGTLLLVAVAIWIASTAIKGPPDNVVGSDVPNSDSRSAIDPRPSKESKRAGLPAPPEATVGLQTSMEYGSPSDVQFSGVDSGNAASASGIFDTSDSELEKPVAPSAARSSERVPVAWNLNDPDDARHRLLSDTLDVWNGSLSAILVGLPSNTPYSDSFMWQASTAANYQGSRIRFSAHLKTTGALSGAHLTLRVEDRMGNVIAFDNMEGRWPRGNSDWQSFSLVLDVPSAADVLIYGVSLAGAGEVRIDSASIEVVDKKIRATGLPVPPGHINPPLTKDQILPVPTNMDFELSTSASN